MSRTVLRERGVRSPRATHLYIFVDSVEAADRVLRQLIPSLRSYDLVLNENKCVLIPKDALGTEEPDLESLFAAAIDEITAQTEDEDFYSDYGFQSEWNEGEADEEDLNLKATTILCNSLSEYPGQEKNMEQVCLPLFSKTHSVCIGARAERFQEATGHDTDLCVLRRQVSG